MPSKTSKKLTKASLAKKKSKGQQLLISRFFSKAPAPPNVAHASDASRKGGDAGLPLANGKNAVGDAEPPRAEPSATAGRSPALETPEKNAASATQKVSQWLDELSPATPATPPEPDAPTTDTPATAVLASPRAAPVSSQSDDDAPVPRKRRRLFVDDADSEEESDRAKRKRVREEADPDFETGDVGEPSDDDDEPMDEVSDGSDAEGEDDTGGAPRDAQRQDKPRTTLASYGLRRGETPTDVPRDPNQRRRFTQKIGRLEKNSFFLRRTGGGGDPDEPQLVAKSKAVKYTPLETQFVTLRKKYPDMLLVVECGYKYRMFDKDAADASKVLRIAAFFDHNFLTASFPTHRLAHHVRRLVTAGYKVGVISQSETAALKKASAKSSTLFERKLSAVYTKGTIAADGKLVGAATGGVTVANAASYIMAILEMDVAEEDGKAADGKIAVAAVDSASGEVFFDCFANDALCSDLESRLVAVEPVEIIMTKKSYSKTTELVVRAYCESMSARLERLPNSKFDPDEVSANLRSSVEKDDISEKFSLEAILSCLGSLVHYLRQFKLELSMTSAMQYKSFRSRRQMRIGADVLRNFEVFGNSNNGGLEGSLIGLVNRTKTAFGSRQMRQWLSHPLTNAQEIRDRLNTVEYLREHVDESPSKYDDTELIENAIAGLVDSLSNLPDLERGLTRVSCHKCTPSEFINVICAIEGVGKKIDHIKCLSQSSVFPSLLSKILSATPMVSKTLESAIVQVLNRGAAADDHHHALFEHDEVSPSEILEREEEGASAFLDVVSELESANKDLKAAEKSMGKLLRALREAYSNPRWEWKKVAQDEYLLEVPVNKASSMPRSWTVICQTKAVKRFRPREAEDGYERILCARETRDAVAARCWLAYLELFASVAAPLRAVVRTLVDLDCLAALARVSNLPGYSKPEIEMSASVPAGLLAEEARHPLTEQLPSCTSYVPNDVRLGRGKDEIAVVISGPNYGGKSSYARMTALISILAQLGSYVPAKRARLSPFDSIHARMGSTDSIAKGMSSLMVELAETSQILSTATSRSLVVLDELGRGTSTHDGSAIAYATLSHLVGELGCRTLFVTHYPMLASLRSVHPKLITACYMNYREENSVDKVTNADEGSEPKHRLSETTSQITFLYKLTEGVASSSYGLNVARLAGISPDVIKTAHIKAVELERKLDEVKVESSWGRIMSERSWQTDAEIRKVLEIHETSQ